MAWSLIPKDVNFFSLFEDHCRKVGEAAKLLQEMAADFTDVERKAKRIKLVEHEADEICHQIYDLVNKSFITPIDREDIGDLAQRLDDVLDNIEGVSSRLWLFGIQQPTPDARAMIDCIVLAVEEIQKAIRELESGAGDGEHVRPYLREIHRLENEVDDISRRMIGRLFHEEQDLRDLIRWKELYNRLENCADRCEDVADIIEQITVKNA